METINTDTSGPPAGQGIPPAAIGKIALAVISMLLVVMVIIDGTYMVRQYRVPWRKLHHQRFDDPRVKVAVHGLLAYSQFKNLVMLWSIGKDSTVLLWLTRKAFFGHVPIPLVHIDTAFKIPEMIEYRDRLAKEWKLNMVYGQNEQALKEKQTFPDGAMSRVDCCRLLKTEALHNTLSGNWTRNLL